MLKPDNAVPQPLFAPGDDQDNLDDAPDQSDVWFKKYSEMPYKDLAARMIELRDAAKKAEREKITLDAEHDIIRLRVVPLRFAEDGMTSMNIDGVGRLGLTKDAYCTQVKGVQEEFFQWLRDNDFGDLIKDTVNPSSLKSLVKELQTESAESVAEFSVGDDDADDKTKFDEITEKYVNFTPFMRASVTKSK